MARRLDQGGGFHPVSVKDVDGEHIALGPDHGCDIVEHNEVEFRGGVGQHGGRGELDVWGGAKGFFEESVAA